MLGLTIINPMEAIRPAASPGDGASGVEASPEDREHDHRQVRRGGDRERQSHQERHIDRLPSLIARKMEIHSDDEGGDPSDQYFLARLRSTPL